jgi:hypothetical protein
VIAGSGVPYILLSDRASNFTSEFAKGVFDQLGIKKQTTAPRSPWANGAAEANIKIAKKIMKKIASERKERWNQVLWIVLMVMRSRIPEGMRISPFEARFGRKMRLPSAFLLPSKPTWDASALEMRNAYEKILRLRDEAAQKMKNQFDAKLKQVEFEIGHRVWLRNEEVTSEHPEERTGPFEVVRNAGPVDVEIAAIPNGPKLTKHKIQNVRNICHYVGPDPGQEREWIVLDVIDHRGHGRGRKYHVKWDNGDTTWVSINNLVDYSDDEIVVNEALDKYLKRHPNIKRPEKRKR